MSPLPRVLIVGFGSIGHRHARNLRALGIANLLVYDADPERSAAAREMGVRGYDTLNAALDAQPAAVLVCTPPASHVEVAVAVAERGCHLFIEKPLANRLDCGVDDLLRIVERRGLIAMVACNMRFHPGLRVVKQLLDEGAVGRVVSVRAEVGQYLPDWHPWEDYRQLYSARQTLGGGIILDAVHELDYLRWLLGEVISVSCLADKLSPLEIDTEDTAALLLRFATGTIGEVHMDYVQRVYSRSCQVIGDEGTIRWDYVEGMTRWYDARKRRWHETPLPPGWKPNNMYLDEMRHFLSCLDGGAQPVLDFFEARRVLEIALAAKRSAETSTVVALAVTGARPSTCLLEDDT